MGSQENDLSCASELSRWKGLEETACGSLLCVDVTESMVGSVIGSVI